MPLQPCLLSSFYTRGVSHPSREMPEEVKDCFRTCPFVEVYAMMEGEAVAWATHWDRPVPATAAQFLSELADPQIDEIAQTIHDRFQAIDHDLKVAGLASFVSEIAYRWPDPIARQGIRAIRNLMKLAQALQRLGHPAHRVEMVAGSRMRGIRPAPLGGFQAHLNETDGQHELLDNLRRVILGEESEPLPGFLPSLRQNPVFLALEAEPGPIFLLSDERSVLSLARRIALDRTLRHFVGLNADISHWRMAKIRPHFLAGTPIQPRLLHVHISGHHPRAHLGDTNPWWINALADFDPWIARLRRVPRQPDGAFGYPGLVSLEYEAARHTDDVLAAITFLHRLLGWHPPLAPAPAGPATPL